jgi:rfaE bifunctional protein nucleotidyltransferase chain/domain
MTPLQQIRNKLYKLPALQEAIIEWKSAGKKIVFTNGCFDILHPGHIDYLAKAAALGNKLIIGLNSDSSVQKLKGAHRPIQDEQARAMLLGALAFVDAIVIFKEDTPAGLIAQILPDVLVKGADYSVEQIAGADTVIKNGGSVVLLPYLKGFSTSEIEKKIKAPK